MTDKDLHLDLVEIDGEPSWLSAQAKAILNYIANASAFEIESFVTDNEEPYNALLDWAQRSLELRKPRNEYLGYAIQAIVDDILGRVPTDSPTVPQEETGVRGDDYTKSPLRWIEDLIRQAEAQKKAGDKYLSVSFTDVDEMRKTLMSALANAADLRMS